MWRHSLLTAALLLLHCFSVTSSATVDLNPNMTASMFHPAESIFCLGPTVFPKPTHAFAEKNDDDVVPIVRPILGTHRPHVDAVFAYAEGYVVGHYILFVESLRATGFDGDVVLAIADEPQEDVVEYLRGQDHVVVYKASLACFDEDRMTPAPRKIKNKAHDIFQMCRLRGVYGKKSDGGDGETTLLEDPRAGRVVATLRYEWYWIWSLQYNADSWFLLLDARDSLFQQNPFPSTLLPRSADEGILYFFGENAQATRLGRSTKNANWLRNAYGNHVLQALRDKPTLCSGSTMGNQRAIETYLRAMVNEWDETDIAMTGADQGFHNYLYYSSKLQNAVNISQLVVWEQGKGIVNNLGALRTQPLSEWGIYNNQTHQVFNWDGSLSPVAHQWDRDQHLFRYTNHQRMKQLVRAWKNHQRKKQ